MPVRVADTLRKTTQLISPVDPETEFTLKYADNRAIVSRQDFFSKVSYITRDSDGETETQRDYPMGTMRIETIMLVLVDWNLTNANGTKYPLTEQYLLDMCDPKEIDALYDKAIDMNAAWGGTEGK